MKSPLLNGMSHTSEEASLFFTRGLSIESVAKPPIDIYPMIKPSQMQALRSTVT